MKNRLWRIVKNIILINIIIYINFTVECSAYSDISFRNITIDEGLSQSSVETILQDRKGYIWMGTNDGLNRYNGYRFKVFRQDIGNDSGIASNYIIDLAEDNEGNIWVGTINGVSKISNSGAKITNYFAEEDKGNLSHYNIGDILVLKDGNILVGTVDGLDIYDYETDSFNPFLEKGSLTSDAIYSLDEDDNGDIWVGTDNGLNKISIENKKVTRYIHNETENSIPADIIYKIYCDKDNIVWLGTYISGAYKVNVKTGEIINFYGDNWGFSEKPGEHIRSFYRDSNDILWISTSNGLIKYDEKNEKNILYRNKNYDKHSLVDDSVFTVIEDSHGMIWVGTYSGVSFFDPNNAIKHYRNDPLDDTTINHNMIHGLYEDDEGYIWVGTNSKGVNILDNNRNNVATINTENNNTISNNRINDIAGYKNFIFLGTSNGLNVIDKQTRTIKIYKEEDGLNSRNIKNLYVDNKNNLWIGTIEGFCILNIENGEITNINYLLENINVYDKYSGAIFQDSEGIYWLGSLINGGVTTINPNTGEVVNYNHHEEDKQSLIDNSIRTISEDKNGHIWIGTSAGLSIYDKSNNSFSNFTTEDGLPNNNIYGIIFDNYGHPWISTNGGISTYNINTNKFINFNMNDGLQSNEFNGEAYLKTRNGELFFGGINGINSFYPEDIEVKSFISSVEFEEFTVNGVSVEDIYGSKFNYNKNNIGVQVFLPDYKNIKGIRYYYMLEGADTEWHLTNTTSILFSNLSPGSYRLRVRAINSKGIISDEGNVSFDIKRPIWRSIPAMFVYFVVITWIVIMQKNKVKRLDNLVDKRTEELRKEMEKNQKLFEKVIKLERNKNSYFINLSHELRTPLNVMHTTEQLITTLNRGDKLEKNKLEYYLSILRRNNTRLLNLINNLIDISKLEHGKYTINKKLVDIVYLVEEVSLSLKDYIEENGIEFIIDPEIEEKIINCDPQDIERCIVNLISNAVKFTPPGGVIKVIIKDLKNSVRIIVSDTGVGISEDYHQLIFNRFNQVVDTNSEIKDGSGLGLTITKQIIDLHNGSINVESAIGEGSSFIIDLPKE